MALSALGAVPNPPDEEIRQQLEEVLSRPEFSPGRVNWARQVLEWIGRLFESLGGLHTTSPMTFWILVVGCLVLLVLLLGHIGWTVRRVLMATGRLLSEEKPEERRGRLSATYRQEAEERASRGDFTEAIRFLFLSLVYRFDETGRVNFQQAYTNREYLSLFSDRPPVRDRLKVFVDTLDDYWYGQRRAERGRYDDCLAAYLRLLP